MAMACQQCDPLSSAWRRREGEPWAVDVSHCFSSSQALWMAKGKDLPAQNAEILHEQQRRSRGVSD